MEHYWPLFAFTGSIISALSLILNQYAKISGRLLVLISRSLMALMSFPVVFFFAPPENPIFYGAILCSSFFVFYADRKMLDLIAAYNSGIVSRLMPLTRAVTFIGWGIISPAVFIGYFNNPFIGTGMIAAFIGSLYFGVRLTHCPVSREAARKFIPVIGAYGVVDIFNKVAMSHSEYHQGVWYYIFVQSIIIAAMGLFCLPHWIKSGHIAKADILNRKTAIMSIFIAMTWMGTMMCRNYAITLSDNPAFAVTIVMLAPIWIILYHKAVGFKDESDIASGLGVVACSIILAVLAVV